MQEKELYKARKELEFLKVEIERLQGNFPKEPDSPTHEEESTKPGPSQVVKGPPSPLSALCALIKKAKKNKSLLNQSGNCVRSYFKS